MKCTGSCNCQTSRKWLISFALLVAILLIALQFLPNEQTSQNTVLADDSAQPQPFSYDDYTAVLQQVDDQGLVNYDHLKQHPEALKHFQKALADLPAKTLKEWPKEKQLALWINAYNALTLVAIVEHYPIKPSALKSLKFPKNSIRQIDGVWDKLIFNVAGRKLTLNQIEHEIIRKEFKTPEIHLALVCAAVSCPSLRSEPYQAEKINTQFQDQVRHFVADPRKFKIDRSSNTVYLSKIFEWFADDFTERFSPESGFAGHKLAQCAVLNYLSRHLDPDDATYLQNQSYQIKYLDYDWTLNEQPPQPPAVEKPNG